VGSVVQMIATFLSFMAVIGTVMFLWRFGHSGPWCSLYRLFPLNVGAKCRGSREVVFFKAEGRWIGFSYIAICFGEGEIILRAPYCLRWLVPSVRVPVSKLKVGRSENIWFRKKLVLLVGQCSVKMALPYKYSSYFDRSLIAK